MDEQLLFVSNVEPLPHQSPQLSTPLKVVVDDNNDLAESTASLRGEGLRKLHQYSSARSAIGR
jgi:hypothetical protein